MKCLVKYLAIVVLKSVSMAIAALPYDSDDDFIVDEEIILF